MIHERSQVAKSAKSVFFEDVNDIDIYIEDTGLGYAKLFAIIFSRIFDGLYAVNKVFPVGNRKAVVDQHEVHVNTGRPSIYVIDSDLYLLGEDVVDSCNGLFKLPFYCIENLLCDPIAIVDFLDEEEPVKERDEISSTFDYEGWLEKNSDVLFELFVEYIVSFKLNPSFATVSYEVKNILSSGTGDVCHDKIRNRIEEVKQNTVKASGDERYYLFREEILKAFSEKPYEKLDIVSGKDYLFPLLKMRAKRIVNTKAQTISLKQRLARGCDLSKLEVAKNFVIT